jgi:succinate dehydrogenase / fumarate reductase cytochrome b subunit
MNTPQLALLFGRYEFFIRRLHSLIGLVPLGGYLCFHLATNAAVWDGPETYQRRADQIQAVGPSTLFFLSWGLIFLPILFHGVIGSVIVTCGNRNVVQYPYLSNFRYTLQRGSGVVAFLFILWHVFQMHGWFQFPWWIEHVARPLGGAKFVPDNAPVSAAAVIQSSIVMAALYAVGVVASVYHLANGLWTMGITWGVWTSPRSQQAASRICAAFGIALTVLGLGALYGMEKVAVPNKARPDTAIHAQANLSQHQAKCPYAEEAKQ